MNVKTLEGDVGPLGARARKELRDSAYGSRGHTGHVLADIFFSLAFEEKKKKIIRACSYSFYLSFPFFHANVRQTHTQHKSFDSFRATPRHCVCVCVKTHTHTREPRRTLSYTLATKTSSLVLSCERPSARRGPGIVSEDRNVRSKCRCSCVLQFTS